MTEMREPPADPQCSCPAAQPHGSNPVPPTTDPDCPRHAVPSPLRLREPLPDKSFAEFVAHWARLVGDMPPVRTEPIKLTSGQWAMLPHGDPGIPQYARPLGDLLGVPVVMVDNEEDSTPVREGWIKPRPDVPGPMPWNPDGGNWEGGCTDSSGQQWRHVPHKGWERCGPSPFLGEPPKRRRWWQRLWRKR